MRPQHFGGQTLSNKPYGIAMYYLHKPWVLKRGWFSKSWVPGKVWELQHVSNRWYRSQKSQRQALEDFSKQPGFKMKFVPFKNDYKNMPQTILKP